jgi:hypothetical protein
MNRISSFRTPTIPLRLPSSLHSLIVGLVSAADALLDQYVPLNNSKLSGTSPGKFNASQKAAIMKKKTKSAIINYMLAEARNNIPSNYPLLAPVLAARSFCPTHFGTLELDHIVKGIKAQNSTFMSKEQNKKAYTDISKFSKRQEQKEEKKQQLLVRKAYVDSLNLANTPDAFLTSQQREKKREILELAERAEQIAEDPEFRPSVTAIDTVNCKVNKRDSKPPAFFRKLNPFIA